jgi:hypothetical protein
MCLFQKTFDDFKLIFLGLSSEKVCKSCRPRKMLQNDPILTIVAVHTAEHEPPKLSYVVLKNVFNRVLSNDESRHYAQVHSQRRGRIMRQESSHHAQIASRSACL